jgi:hypothetical protein
MSCPECFNNDAPGALNEAVDNYVVNVVMCLRCRHGGTSGRCRRTDRPVAEITIMGECPKRRHAKPGARPIVRWMLLRWYGVPKPLRLGLPERYKLTGCGCVVVLKDVWTWITSTFGVVMTPARKA